MRIAPLCIVIMFSMLSSACALLGIGTKPGLNLEEGEKERLQREFSTKEFVLASSVYAGNFFGHGDKLFIDARPFDIIDVYSLNGDKAPVLPATGEIIPAGTPVEITKIVYPTSGIQGALGDDGDETQLTPSGHAWLILEQLGTTSTTKKPLVIVLPRELPSLQAFRDAVKARLKSPQWVISWLNTRSALAIDNIFSKRVEAGMSQPEVLAALGVPRNFQESQNLDAINWVANYGDLQVTLQGNVVQEVVSLRAVAETRRLAAMEQAKVAAENRRREEEARLAQAEREKAEAELAATRAEAVHQEELKAQAAERERIRAQAAKEREALQKKMEKERLARQKQMAKERAKRGKIAAAQAKRAPVTTAAAPAPAPAPAVAKPVVAAAPVAAASGALDLDADLNGEPGAANVQRRRPFVLEARFEKLTRKSARALGRKNTNGALVMTVRPRGAIRELGLMPNDLILELNGKRVKNPDELKNSLSQLSFGAQVTMRVWRNKVVVDLPQRAGTRAQRSTAIQLQNP